MKNRTLAFTLVLVALLGLAFLGTRTSTATPSDTFAGGISGTLTRNTVPKVNGPSKLTDSLFSDDGTTATIAGALSITGTLTNTGQLKTTKDPASTANTNASILANPATSAANELFLGLLDNGSTVFSVDKEGDIVGLGGLILNTNKFTVASASGNTLIAGTGDVTGNFAVNTNKFSVNATSGNTAVAGTLVSTGAINGPFGGQRLTASTLTLTAALSGQLIVVANASDAVTTITLPAASTAGLRFCFAADSVTGSNREIDVEPPAGSDLIIGTTNAAGATGIATTAGAAHGIKNTHATAVRGNSTCIGSDGTNTWYMTSLSGTWAAY